MIAKLHIQNFKCFRDCQVELGKFNVLVGPNDSGKTSFLQAIQVVAGLKLNGQLLFNEARASVGLGDPIRWKDQPERVVFEVFAGGDLSSADKCGAVVANPGKPYFGLEESSIDRLRANVGTAKYHRLSPTALRTPSGVDKTEMTADGGCFPSFLESMLRSDRRRFFDMEQEFFQRFPAYQVEIRREGTTNHLAFSLGGQRLSVENVSDGVILTLAYLAIAYQPEPPKILLIEEPENGVHYSGLEQVVKALQALVTDRDLQIIMTTHSPYLLDLVEPQDVLVFAKDRESGEVQIKRMSDSEQVKRLQGHMMTGEIWTELPEEQIVFGREAGEK